MSQPYVALPRNISVLGKPFVAFRTEQGEPVISQTSFANGMGMVETSSRNLRKVESMKAIASKSSTPATLKVKSAKGNTATIACMSLAEVTEGVRILADRGNIQAKSMMEASFATVLLLEVQRQFNDDQHNKQVLEQAAKVRQNLADRRAQRNLGKARQDHKPSYSNRGKLFLACGVPRHLHLHLTDADYKIFVGKTAKQYLAQYGLTKPELAIEYFPVKTQARLVIAHELQGAAIEKHQPKGYIETKKLTTSVSQQLHDTLAALEQKILENG